MVHIWDVVMAFGHDVTFLHIIRNCDGTILEVNT